jgi:hypothetical protein
VGEGHQPKLRVARRAASLSWGELATEIEWHAAGASRMYLPAVHTQLRGMRDQLNTRKQHNHSHTNEMANEMAR